MKHLGTKTLETTRLWLRKFTLEDAQDMYDNWASDDEVTKYLMWSAHRDTSVTEAVLREWAAGYEKDDFYLWAIVPKDNGDRPIGNIAVVSWEEQVKKAQIGYCLGKAWWHRGITAEALQAVIGFLLYQVGVQRVEAYHDIRNPASGAVMRKCGMTYEGTLRQSAWNNQGICDAAWYAILAK